MYIVVGINYYQLSMYVVIVVFQYLIGLGSILYICILSFFFEKDCQDVFWDVYMVYMQWLYVLYFFFGGGFFGYDVV